MKLLATLVTVALVSSFADAGSTMPANVVALEPEHGPELVRPCNSVGPENARDFFKPTPQEIAASESATSALLQERRAEYEQSGSRPQSRPKAFNWPDERSSYYRQYIGYVADGRRMIYGVFLPSGQMTSSERFQLWFPKRPMIVCDAGPSIFMTQYDIEKGAILRIDFSSGWGGGLPSIVPTDR